MSNVALVGCRSHPDPDMPILIGALSRLGIDAAAVVWDDPDVVWDVFDATVLRSTWDYPSALGAFLQWTADVPTLINPAAVVAWNVDKRYLDELARHDVPTIETTYATSGATAVFPDGTFVVKPTVGGGSRGAAKFAADEHDLARSHVDALVTLGVDAMIQPFIASVTTNGETDLVYIDGVLSHALIKHAPLHSVASDTPSGPTEVTFTTPSEAELRVAEAALDVVPHDGPLCFARVDLVSTPEGPVVIEVELVEPFLWLSSAGACADLLAQAIARRIAN